MQYQGGIVKKIEKENLIFLVDDFNCDRELITRQLISLGYQNIITATNLSEAEQVLRKHIDKIKIVFLDACIESHSPDSMPIISLAKKLDFQGVIVGMSGSAGYLEKLESAGADYSMTKDGVVGYLQREGVL